MWASSLIPLEQRKKFIARRLELADVNFKRKHFNQELLEFTRDYVKMDGVFVLNMLTIHAGLLICTEIVDQMWDNFLEEKHGGEKSPGLASGPETPGPGFSGKRKTSVLMPLVSRDDSLLPTTPQPGSMAESPFLRPSLPGK